MIVGRLDEGSPVTRSTSTTLRILSKPWASIGGRRRRDARHHALHRLAGHELVGEFANAGLAPKQDARRVETECRTWLRARSSRSCSEAVENIRSGAEPHGLDLVRLQVVVGDDLQHGIHARMAEHAARVRLTEMPGFDDRCGWPRTRQGGRGRRRRRRPGRTPTARRALVAAGKSARRQLRGKHADLRGAADVQRLGHRSEVDPNAGGQARRNRQHVRYLAFVELHQLGGRGGRAKRADRARGVEAVDVVRRVDRLGDLALHLESDEKGFEEREPDTPVRSPTASAAASAGSGRMRQQP